MATSREKRIKSMQESMDRLQKEYDVKDSRKKKAKKSKAKPKRKANSTKAPFSVFGLAGKIKARKAVNRKAATD